MKLNEQTFKDAITKAIKAMGLKYFKQTSFFGSNNK